MAKHFQVDTGSTLTTSLVAYWPFEGNSNDYYGSDNGSDTSMSYGSSYGKVSNGANFSGSGWIDLSTPSNLNFDGTGPLSVAMWVKYTTTGNVALIGHIGNLSHTSQGWVVMVAGGRTYLQLHAGTSSGTQEMQTASGTSNATSNDGNWHLIAATYDGSKAASGVKFYLDGSLLNVSNYQTDYNTLSNAISSSSHATIGSCASGVSKWTGYMDEVGVWSKVLVAQEITDLYNSGSGQTMVSSNAYTSTPSDNILNGASRSSTMGRVSTYLRSYSDSILNGASRSSAIGRLTTNARALSASIMNSASRLATITKGLARSASVSMMNSASRFATVARLGTFARSTSDSIMNAASRTVTITKGLARGVSASIMNAVSRLATIGRAGTFSRSTSDSVLRGASRTATIGRLSTYLRSMSDSILNAASRLATITGVKGFVRAVGDYIMNAGNTSIASYPEANYVGGYAPFGGSTYEYVGEAFTPAVSTTLVGVIFDLAKAGSPTGNIAATVYATTLSGSNYVPTGSPLATSANIDISTLGGHKLITFAFSGTQSITLSAGTCYAVVTWYAGGDINNGPRVGYGTSSLPSGNAFKSSDGSSWNVLTTALIFYVYANVPRLATLTDLGTYLRSMADSVMTAASRSITLARAGTFARALADSIINAASRLVSVAGIKTILRSLGDSVMNAASRFASLIGFKTFIGSMSDSIMNAASRFASITRIGTFARTIAGNIMNAASRLTTLGGMKTFLFYLSDSLMNAANRFVSITRIGSFARAFTDSILNAASRLTAATRVLSRVRALSDSIMNAASRFVTMSKLLTLNRYLSDSMMAARNRFVTMKAYLNGLLVQFTSKYKVQGTSFSGKYTPQGTTYSDKYTKQNTEFDPKYQ